MEQRKMEIAGKQWSYLVQGTGSKALLFIHGASSSNKIWKYQYQLEVTDHKLIFVDLLGYGESDKPTEGYGLNHWVEGLESILDQEETDQVQIVAHSNGVILAKEYYRSYRRKVQRLILLDGMLKPMISQEVLSWMKQALERSDYKEFMANIVNSMPTQGLSEEDAALLRTDGLSTPQQVSAAELEMVSNPDTWKELTLDCPVIILHSLNPMWTDEYLAYLTEIAPHHELKEWKDAGHFIQLQYPGRLNKLILEFMQ